MNGKALALVLENKLIAKGIQVTFESMCRELLSLTQQDLLHLIVRIKV